MSYQCQYISDTPIHFPLGKLVRVGHSYAEHAKELNNPVPTEPLLFVEPGSCVMPMSGGLGLPQEHSSVHYEAGIAVLIGGPLSRKPSHKEALDAISGYAPALDLALREIQARLKEKDLPWELAKNFDGAGVLSPFVNADRPPGSTDIDTHLAISDEIHQDDNSRDMLNLIVPLIQHITGYFSLQAGDVVLTGTPSGVGPLNSDDGLLLELPGTSRFKTHML